MTAPTQDLDQRTGHHRPPVRRFRRAVVGLTAVGLAAAGLAAAGSTAGAVGRPALPTVLPASATVLLPTGDRVRAGTDPAGRPDVRIVHAVASGPGATLTTARLGGDTYVIPASARPYLGRYLDPSLFDVTRLARAGVGSRVPVSISYTGAAAPALPGVTVTAASAGHASGYLTAASARTFGAALARQAVADSLAGWPASSSLFGRVTRVTADVAPLVQPAFPMRTLIVKGITPAGKPMRFGFGVVANSDDSRKGGYFFTIVDGEARVSVPLGHYVALVENDVFTADGQFVSHVGAATDYLVSGQDQVLTVDTRTATSTNPSVTTPRPTRVQELQVNLWGFDGRGEASFGLGFATAPPFGRLFMTPVAGQQFGHLVQTTKVWTVDPSVPGGRYAYDAAWEDVGIPADQHRTVPATGLARVDSSWSSDVPLKTVGTLRAMLTPSEFGAFTTFFRAPAPLSRTDFVYAPARSQILEGALGDYDAPFEADPGFVDDFTSHLATPGSRRSQGWLGTPYQLTPLDDAGICAICRDGTSMVVAADLHDSDPAHSAALFTSLDGTPVAHFTVFKDGVKLLSRPDSTGEIFTVPAGVASYRVLTDTDRFLQSANLSTRQVAELTFSSGSGQGPLASPDDFCPAGDGTGCRVLPALTAHLDLHASLTGGVPVGTSTFTATVGRIRGAAPSAVTAVSVQVRRNGTTGAWTSLPVTPAAAGGYAAAFTARAGQAGQTMDVQVLARDAAGSTVRVTTERAFVIGG